MLHNVRIVLLHELVVKKNQITTLKVTWLAIMKDLNPISQVSWHYRRLIFGSAYGAALKWTKFFAFRTLLIHWSKPKRKTHFSILRFFELLSHQFEIKIIVISLLERAPLTIELGTCHLCEFRINNATFYFHILLRYIFVFHLKISVFIVFIYLFIYFFFLMKYQISAAEYQTTRNRYWW